jgi:hypothetical protein
LINFRVLANVVVGEQVQGVRPITATNPRWQQMPEGLFRLTASVANCYLIDQRKVLGMSGEFGVFSGTILADRNFLDI